jgi:erythromycin esterase-like protein
MAGSVSFASLDDWIRREAISFALDSSTSFNAAVDKIVAALGDSVELLGLGEPTHMAEDFLVFRNRIFQRLVEAHGYTAIAVESSFPRGRVVNEYVLGCGAKLYDDVQEIGFSHGFGRMAANRELVEWMRAYNANAAHPVKLHFYGFDGPMEMMFADSPRQSLEFVLGYLGSIDRDSAQLQRDRIEPLFGNDADWENQAAAMDPSKSIGRSPAATSLRIAVDELATELLIRRPELVAASDAKRYAEAVHYASSAGQLLVYHAALAGSSDNRLVECLGIRDAMMADNLAYIVSRERGHASTSSGPAGKVLAFAHNSHLKRGKAEWQLGPNALAWWSAGSHLTHVLGSRYAVIGVSAGVCEARGLGEPGPESLEGILTGLPGTGRFVPTHLGEGLPTSGIAAIVTRSVTNPAYFPFTSQSLTDFDCLAVLESVA